LGLVPFENRINSFYLYFHIKKPAKMKKLITLCTVLLSCVALSAMSQTGESKVTKEPQLVFVPNSKNPTGSTYLFGDIPQGKPVTAEFVFINKGQDPLIISEVVQSLIIPSCR
jgi:hypothetical protein